LPHLKHQLILMHKEKERLLTLIDTLEKTIESKERKMTMTTEEKFKGFTFKDNEKYKQAATEKYGETVLNETAEKQKGKSILMSTHVLDSAEKMCDAFVILHKGEVRALGNLQQLREAFDMSEASLNDIYLALTKEGDL